MVLHFEADLVRKLLAHANAAPERFKNFEGEPQQGLLLVGDRGVYLMSTGLPGIKEDGTLGPPDPEQGERYLVCYADEINPFLLPLDVWFAAKEESFGADDGTENIKPGMVEEWLTRAKDGKLKMELSEEEFDLL